MQVKEGLAAVDTKTLAAVLGVSPRTVRRLTARGKIPVVRVTPRRPRYIVADVLGALVTWGGASKGGENESVQGDA